MAWAWARAVRSWFTSRCSMPSHTRPAGARGGLRRSCRERSRVLGVDDNTDAAETLAMVLESDGHEVKVVHDAREVVAVADRFRPDVAILDIGLPHIDGYQVARNLRGRAGTAKAVLIALTGYGQPDDVERAHCGVRSPPG